MVALDIWHKQTMKDEGSIVRVSASTTLVHRIDMAKQGEVSASTEAPMSAVRRGLHEFSATDAQPSDVESDAK
ncbi:hypothetical protein [Amycolatopsis sp. CB00013]|uniref:hypothetical protein n=1 Tax=Amycolatopsis sp. CB00013 TaxID=1703945 RepID=UPI00093E2FBA|nr:hypothetical protein [Amycolatopsis sp. CB00013]OKJ97521.1 hypothetical protein AMK34_11085 [Amycolatopsis sp. CB00013]